MKDLMRSLTTTLAVLAVSTLMAAHFKIPVKYSQYFAERQIIITEHMTLAERLLLPQKKGLIEIYE